MEEALAALETAVEELLEARRALPDDVGDELDDVIERAQAILDSLRGPPPEN